MSESFPRRIGLPEQQESEQRVLLNEELRTVELEIIRRRRQRAGFETGEETFLGREVDGDAGLSEEPGEGEQQPAHAEAADDTAEVEKSLVGVAFSGGGIRSAAYNLGLAQALHYFGVLRFTDYLSSVSGGSYVSAMISHSVSKQDKYDQESFEYRSVPNGRQPTPVRQLVKNGNYLIRLDLLANRYVAGLLINLIPLASLLVALGAGIAWLWRCLDYNYFRDQLDGLGLTSDFAPALLPTVLIFLVWFVACILALWLCSEPLKKWSNRLFWAGCLSLLISGAVLLGNGDITRQGSEGEIRYTDQRWIGQILLVAAGLGLLPLLRPDMLIRSGAAPRRFLDSWVFYYTSFVLLLGLPLILVALFAHENVSGFITWRGPFVVPGEIKERSAFCQWLRDPDIKNIQIGEYDVTLNPVAFREVTSPEIRPKWSQATEEDDRGAFFLVQHVPPQQESTESGGETDAPPPASIRDLAARLIMHDILSAAAQERLRGTSTWQGVDPDQPAPPRARLIVDWLAEKGIDPTNPQDHGDAIEKINELLHIETDKTRQAEEEAAADSTPSPAELLWYDAQQFAKYDESIASNSKALSTYSHETVSRAWLDWRYWNFLRRWGSYASSFLEGNSSKFSEFLKQRQDRREAEADLCQAINERLLSRGDLFQVRLGKGNASQRQLAAADVSKQDRELLAVAAEIDEIHPGASWEHAVARNRRILELLLPEMLRRQGDIRRTTVHGHDQSHRLIWFGGALVLFVISSWLIDPNTTSLHEYYRDRLGNAFLREPKGIVSEARVSLAQCRPHEFGAPYPLFGAAVCEQSPTVHPSQLEPPFTPFLLSPAYCGSDRLGYVQTKDYVPEAELTVADATAISGAALSPSYFVHHIVMAVMTLLNLRMGKWLPNPAGEPGKPFRPRLLQQLRADFERDVRRRKLLQVTDGGHVENLGLGALLERRCRLMILSDAGQDVNFAFEDFASLVRKYRNEFGMEFLELDGKTRLNVSGRFPKRTMKAGTQKNADARDDLDRPFTHQKKEQRHFFVARIRYPGEEQATGWLYYLKPCLAGYEDVDLYNYALGHPTFPHDPTADQAFSESQFESYRRLGAISGADLCRKLMDKPDTLWDAPRFDFDTLRYYLGGPITRPILQSLAETVVEGDDPEKVAAAREELAALGDAAAAHVLKLLEWSYGRAPHEAASLVLKNLGRAGVQQLAEILSDSSLHDSLAIEAVIYLEYYLDSEEHAELAQRSLRRAADAHAAEAVRQAAESALKTEADRQEGQTAGKARPKMASRADS